MKTRFVLIICFLMSSFAQAHSDQFWKSLNNDFIKMEMKYEKNAIVKSRYPRAMRTILEGVFGWYPGTTWDQESQCSLEELKAAIQSEILPSKKQSIVANYVQNCSPVHSRMNFMNGLKIISQKGSFTSHPFFKYSFLSYPGGIKTRALWGIRAAEKRDLLIVRPGIYASVDEVIAERYILFLLTEINGYHVVVLENSTSGDHIVNNDVVSVGGAKEAYENLYLIEQIRKHPQLAPLVDKIHLLGVSLGANGVLLASLVNQKNERKYFDKTFLFCPVVDLPASFQTQMESGFRPLLLDWWSSHRFQDIEGKSDFQLESLWDSISSLSPRWVKGAWSWFHKKYRFHKDWQLYLGKDFYTGEFDKDYSFFNDQTTLPDQLYVLATKTDPIVFPEINFHLLEKKGHDKTFFYQFEDGFHCSFAYTYQWKFLDTLFTSMINSEMPVDSGPKKEKYELVIDTRHHRAIESSQLDIRSVEVSKLDFESVELLVYFSTRAHQTDAFLSGHVKIPLKDLYLDAHHTDYDPEAIRNFIKRYLQTKFRIQKEANKFIIHNS